MIYPISRSASCLLPSAFLYESSAFLLPSTSKAVDRPLLPTTTACYMISSGDDADEDSKQLFDKMTQDMFGSGRSNPFASSLRNIGKGDLYDEGELKSLFSLHTRLADEPGKVNIADCAASEEEVPASLHDLIAQTIGEEPPATRGYDVSTAPSGVRGLDVLLDSAMQSRMKEIRGIASDVDGTLLSSRQTLHPRTRLAVKRALERAKRSAGRWHFFLATGKSRKGALDSLGIEIGSLIAAGNVPGVYLQGLYCVDGEGKVVFEKKLTAEATAQAEEVARKSGISIVAYDGDDLYTTEVTEIVRHLHEHYGEPLPGLLPSSEGHVRDLADHEPCMHKLLLMDDDAELLSTQVRPQLEKLAEKYGACVTQALPTMLEWLPAGCSKAAGVSNVCSALGIDMETELLALGDAENDAEMIKMASIGVAMGNGCPLAKEAADFVLDDTHNDGGAGIAMEMFGFDGL